MTLPPNLSDHIRAYLTSPEVDLQTVSAKQIRKKLATIFPDLDIKTLRSEIDDISIPIFHQIKESVEEAAAKAAQHHVSINPAGATTAPFNHPSQPSSLPPLALPRAVSTPDNSQSTKPIIKKSSQEPPTTTTTTTQRNGSKAKKRKSAAYVDTDDEDGPSGNKTARNGNKKPKAPRKPRPEGEGPGSNKGIHVELNCSTALAELIGVPMCSRPQVVKKIWDYIKANGLQNPQDKRQIICDEAMKKVFNQNSVHMFTMNKLLADHLYKAEEVIQKPPQ